MRSFVFISFLVILISVVHASGQNESVHTVNSDLLQEKEAELYDLAHAIITENTDGEDALNEYDSLLQFWSEEIDEDSTEYRYLHALVLKEKSIILEETDLKRATEYFYDALDSAQTVVDSNPDFAGAYAVLASLQNLTFVYEGPLAGMGYLSSIQKLNRQALSINRTDPLAWETTGQLYLFTPQGFGGDMDKAIEAFEMQREHGNAYQHLWGNIWLSVAYLESGRYADALDTIGSVRAEFPESIFIENIEQATRDKRNPFN